MKLGVRTVVIPKAEALEAIRAQIETGLNSGPIPADQIFTKLGPQNFLT